MDRYLAIVVILLSIVVVVFLCSQPRQSEVLDSVREVRRLQEQTDPTGAAASRSAVFTKDPYAIRAEWTITPGMTEDDYARWLAEHEPPDYALVENAASGIVLRKKLPGDSLVLQLTPENDAAVHMRAKFVAAAD